MSVQLQAQQCQPGVHGSLVPVPAGAYASAHNFPVTHSSLPHQPLWHSPQLLASGQHCTYNAPHNSQVGSRQAPEPSLPAS